MVKGQLYRSSTELRITSNFPTFTEFCCGNSIQNSEFIEDQVEKIESVEYNDYVYDFTMNEVNHNFIANCIVSHNCGMRLLTTNLTFKDVKPKLRQVVDLLFETVPTGVGCEGSIKLSQSQFDEVMSDGSEWCARNGYAWKEDVERTEENGKLEQADPSKVSQRARSRGIKQLGTLGSGNHYLEIQVAGEKEVFDSATAKAWGITEPDQVVVMFHCGSRGFGHQICSDYVELFLRKLDDYKISLPDRELACAPFQSREGQDYFGAMCAAINFSFASRQVILHRVREAFAKVFKTDAEKLGMDMVYDVAHNTAKIEEYKVDGKKQKLVVHRKGATRCFGPSRPELEKLFRKTGQPVIVGGSMETGSYLCVGTDKADDETFASTMHGSGRTMSRAQAKREIRGDALQRDMEKRGIYVRSASMSGLAEEAGVAYKDIHQVVETMDIAGISKRVVALRPVGNIKG
ncbi:RtcB family protein [Candidatus Micrarchaeota archaeon]|nr:RtcB family protein [Candidatus Micrarchaeota archaeon]